MSHVEKWATVPTYEALYEGKVVYGYYADGVVFDHTKSEHVIQHRPKPTNLLANQTELPVQFDDMYTLGLAYEEHNWEGWPGWSYRNYYTTVFPASYYQPEVPHWETDMLMKIKGTAVNLAETLGEYRESVAAFQGATDVMKRAWTEAKTRYQTGRGSRRRNPYAGKNWRKKVALDILGADLAVKFGVIPYINLALDSLDALEKAATDGVVKRFVVTKKAISEDEITYGYFMYRWQCVSSYRAICYVRFNPNRGNFTAGNPLEAIWAGVGLSFMVDWFLDVGSFLSALDALHGVDGVSGTLTKKETWRADCFNGNGWHGMPLVALHRHRSHERDFLATVPMPRTPVWKPSVSWGKLQSSIEILLGMKLSKRR